MKNHHQIIIIGGGNAGISVAAQLLLKNNKLNIAIVDPTKYHYYQPAWTLVGGGDFDITKTQRLQESVIPSGATWIKEKANTFQPEKNSLQTEEGGTYTYDYMIVCPGIQINWHLIKGLKETLGKNNVCSNYAFDQAPYTFECIKNTTKGNALFTNPGTPIKCGGAPQKIMYLAAHYFKNTNVANQIYVKYYSAGGVIFGVKKYADALLKVVVRYGIDLCFRHDLIEVDGKNKKAIFKMTDVEGNVKKVEKYFDMIHVTPPQSAPDFIKKSSLANEAGWVDVHKHTLQHNKFANVFALGDVASTPNAKTGAAIRKQAPVLVANLLNLMKNKSLKASYNGYGSCPLVTGYGKLILAEFDYTNTPVETFPFDQSKERWSMYQLKKQLLPWMYWNKVLKGTM